jgi:hypothetical protein
MTGGGGGGGIILPPTPTTTSEAKQTVNQVYVDVYLKRRFPDGTFEADWLDITRWVLSNGFDTISYSLDSGDFDFGIFNVSNVRLALDNSGGRFNDPEDSRSLWASLITRQLNKVKIESGYLNPTTMEKMVEQVFEGIIDERSFIEDPANDSVSCMVLSRESVFGTVNVVGGMLGSVPLLASEAIYMLCNRPEITDFMTVTATNIVPNNDVLIDVPNAWAGNKLDTTLNEIMLITNSILYIDGAGAMIVRNRSHSRRVMWEMNQNASSGKSDNIYGIDNKNSGRQRVKNYFYWAGSSLFASSLDEFIARYGMTKKSVDSSAITSSITRQAILDNLLSEWQFPKEEFEITTDYTANILSFFDMVTIDFVPELTRRDNIPIAGLAIAGTAISIDYASGTKINPAKGYKILGFEHSLANFTTKLKVREIGNQLNDGWIHVILSKQIQVVFAAETYKDIDVSLYSMNAQRCLVQVKLASGTYPSEEFRIESPSSSIIRLSAGVAVTGTYNVLCSEVEA